MCMCAQQGLDPCLKIRTAFLEHAISIVQVAAIPYICCSFFRVIVIFFTMYSPIISAIFMLIVLYCSVAFLF